MKALLATAAFTLVLAAGATSGTSGASGLYGKVTRGPIMPVCREGVPCDGPAAGVTLTFTRSGQTVSRVKTDRKGLYRVKLKPGRYVVRLVGTRFARSGQPEPKTVRVVGNRFSRVNFYLDTGIR